MKKIAHVNKYDLELWRWAKERLCQQIEERPGVVAVLRKSEKKEGVFFDEEKLKVVCPDWRG